MKDAADAAEAKEVAAAGIGGKAAAGAAGAARAKRQKRLVVSLAASAVEVGEDGETARTREFRRRLRTTIIRLLRCLVEAGAYYVHVLPSMANPADLVHIEGSMVHLYVRKVEDLASKLAKLEERSTLAFLHGNDDPLQLGSIHHLDADLLKSPLKEIAAAPSSLFMHLTNDDDDDEAGVIAIYQRLLGAQRVVEETADAMEELLVRLWPNVGGFRSLSARDWSAENGRSKVVFKPGVVDLGTDLGEVTGSLMHIQSDLDRLLFKISPGSDSEAVELPICRPPGVSSHSGPFWEDKTAVRKLLDTMGKGDQLWCGSFASLLRKAFYNEKGRVSMAKSRKKFKMAAEAVENKGSKVAKDDNKG
jgi:hypothetical protein